MFTIRQINRFVLSEYSKEYRALDILPIDMANQVDLFDARDSVVRKMSDLSATSSLDGCRHWQVYTRAGLFCLRRWCSGMLGKNRLQFIQAVLWHAVCEGITFIPLPVETIEHRGFVTFDNAYWELLPWIDGVEERPPLHTVGIDSDVDVIDDALIERYGNMSIPSHRIVSAMRSLAQFHRAVSTFPLPNPPVGYSYTISNLLSKWRNWISGGFDNLYREIRDRWCVTTSRSLIDFAETGLRFQNNAVIHSGQAIEGLTRSSRMVVQIQPVIGNCCLRHLRFSDAGVCGMIDFKEVVVDSVMVDVVSLLSSMSSLDSTSWQVGLRAYQQIRQLDDYEIFMLKTLYHSLFLLEGLDYLTDFFLLNKPMNEYQINKITDRLEYWNLRMETENRNRTSA
jgi:hypothetical protein